MPIEEPDVTFIRVPTAKSVNEVPDPVTALEPTDIDTVHVTVVNQLFAAPLSLK